jgi:hypothetical protein
MIYTKTVVEVKISVAVSNRNILTYVSLSAVSKNHDSRFVPLKLKSRRELCVQYRQRAFDNSTSKS